MIKLDDLNEAIKECEGQRSPNANTALKLAAYYTIRNELYPDNQPAPIDRGYSYDPPAAAEVISYESDTIFGKTVHGKETAPVMAILDDLMSVLQSAQPRLHRRIVGKIDEI